MSGRGSRRSRATKNVSAALRNLIAENNKADREQFGSNSNNSARMNKNLATLKSNIPRPPTPPNPSKRERRLSENFPRPPNIPNSPSSNNNNSNSQRSNNNSNSQGSEFSFNYNPDLFEKAPAPVAPATPAAPENNFKYNAANFDAEEYDEQNCLDFPESDFCQKIVKDVIREERFAHFEVPADGNCFFYSIRAWVLLTDYEGTIADGRPLRALKPNDMRKYLVSYGQSPPRINTGFLRME
jgi:hypothetical protein